MRNKSIIKELKKLDPDSEVDITIELTKKSLLEICYHNGYKFGKKFTCDTETVWRTAELANDGMSVLDLIELLESKEVSEMTDEDFHNLSVINTTDGGVDVLNIEWEEPLTEEEELDFSQNDLYWDSEITDSELQFGEGSIYTLTIKCGDYEKTI